MEAIHGWADPEGTYRAASRSTRPCVVVACGSLESPALLQRSGIGGPAAGNYLRLHPCIAIFGSTPRTSERGGERPRPALCNEFADTGDGYGFLIETAQYAPGLIGSATPWVSGRTTRSG